MYIPRNAYSTIHQEIVTSLAQLTVLNSRRQLHSLQYNTVGDSYIPHIAYSTIQQEIVTSLNTLQQEIVTSLAYLTVHYSRKQLHPSHSLQYKTVADSYIPYSTIQQQIVTSLTYLTVQYNRRQLHTLQQEIVTLRTGSYAPAIHDSSA